MTPRSLAIACAVASFLGLAGTACRGGEEPMRIGVLTECQGPLRGFEEAELSAAELPLLRRGARLSGAGPTAGVTPVVVAGRKVELVRGCSELGELTVFIDEARRLVEHEHVDAVVGGGSVVAREVARLYPDVPFVATFYDDQETTLRRPARNLYRFTPDFGQLAAGLGAYAYNELGWRRASILAGDQSAGWGGAAAFVAEFCSLGGKIVRQVYRSPYTPEPDAVARAVGGDADGIALFLHAFDAPMSVLPGVLERLDDPSRQLLLWAPQLEDPALLKTLGPKLDGVALTSWLPAGPAHVALREHRAFYRASFPRLPAEFADLSFTIGYSDSVEAVLAALERAHGELSDGRRLFRGELAGIRLALPRGAVHLDANRQAVTDVRLVRLRPRDGEAATEPISVAQDVDQSFGGLLSHAPPPAPGSQPCKRATPPPWARERRPASAGDRPREPRLRASRRETAGSHPAPDENRWRRRLRGEGGARPAEALPSPAVGQAYHDHTGIAGGNHERVRFRLDEHRLGRNPERPLYGNRRAGEQPARVPAVRTAHRTHQAEARPAATGEPRPQLDGGPVVVRAREWDDDRAGARHPRTTIPTSHGAWSSKPSTRASSSRPSGASASTRSMSLSRARRAMSMPGATDVKTAALASTPAATSCARTSLISVPAADSSPGVETVVSSRSSRCGSRASGSASAAS
jgi:branched-chain amino acid transport system substrate-binding protein